MRSDKSPKNRIIQPRQYLQITRTAHTLAWNMLIMKGDAIH